MMRGVICECPFRWWEPYLLLPAFNVDVSVEFSEGVGVSRGCPLRCVDGSSGGAATSGLRSEHLRQLLVLEAALQELVLRQLPVVVLVHLREYVLRPLLRAVRRPIARTCAEHVVYRLGTEGQHFVSPRGIHVESMRHTRLRRIRLAHLEHQSIFWRIGARRVVLYQRLGIRRTIDVSQ